MTKHAAVRFGNQTGTVHQRLDLRGDIGNVGRRAQQDPVRPVHFLDTDVPHVVFLRAAAVLPHRTLAAGKAAMDFGTTQFH